MGKRRDFCKTSRKSRVPVWLLWKVYVYLPNSKQRELDIHPALIFFSGFFRSKKSWGHLFKAIQYIQWTIMPSFFILWWFLPSSKGVSTTIFFENRKIHLNLVDECFTPRFHDQPLSDLEAHRFHLLTIFPPAKDAEVCETDFYQPKKNGEIWTQPTHLFLERYTFLECSVFLMLFEGFMIII